MPKRIQQKTELGVGETEAVAIDYQDHLDTGELLTGTPTVTEASGTLTLGSKAVNTAALTILGRSVAIGQAVQFTAAGAALGVKYVFTITVSTDAGRVLVREAVCEGV